MSELLEKAKEISEPLVEKLIEERLDGAVDALLAEIEKHTPDIVDQLLEMGKPKMKEILKAELLKQAEKISDRV